MRLAEFIDEVSPTNDEQNDYQVMIEYSDETGTGDFPVGEVRWDHQEQKVIIEVDGVA